MFEHKLITSMKNFNQFIHVLLALALVVACVMVIWDFGLKAAEAWPAGSAANGFFHALGSLFILWTLSTLISAEMSYLQTGKIYVRVFVEVAMISVIREMIVQPVQVITAGQGESNFSPVHYGLLLVVLLVIGVVYKLVSNPKLDESTETQGNSDATQPLNN